MKDVLVFLVEAHLKLVLDYSSEVGYCKVDFHNVHVESGSVPLKVSGMWALVPLALVLGLGV